MLATSCKIVEHWSLSCALSWFILKSVSRLVVNIEHMSFCFSVKRSMSSAENGT